MIKLLTMLSALLYWSLGAAVHADEWTEASQALCDNVRTCVLEQMASEDMPPDVRQMVEPMVENMCAGMSSMVQEVPLDHGLRQPALACLRSMQSLTCEQMQSPEQAETAECKEYEKKAAMVGGQ